MKKTLLFVFALVLSFGLKAQCPLTQAVDFTATDCHGTEVHLFDILDGGQYVIIDFFYTACGPCQQATPKIRDSYTALGCNMYEVYYMEISDRDSDAVCLNWVSNYGIEYPTISGVAGGSGICNTYQIGAFPTVILVAPDHSIVINDLWPINNAQTIINAVAPYGIEEHDCAGPSGELTITPDTLWFYNMGDDQTFTILNETADAVTIEDIVPEAGSALEIWQPSFPYTLEAGESVDVVVGYQVPPLKDDFSSFIINVMTTLGERQVVAMIENTALDLGMILGPYFMVGLDAENPTLDLYLANGNAGTQTPFEIYSILETPSEEGPYLNIDLSSELPYTLNYGEDAFHFTISPLYKGGKDGVNTTIEIIHSGGSDYYNVWIDGELLSITEINNTWSLYPNPANESLTLKGTNLGTVKVYNAIGQQMESIVATGDELNINTAGYANGVYFIKVNESTLRFVISH